MKPLIMVGMHENHYIVEAVLFRNYKQEENKKSRKRAGARKSEDRVV